MERLWGHKELDTTEQLTLRFFFLSLTPSAPCMPSAFPCLHLLPEVSELGMSASKGKTWARGLPQATSPQVGKAAEPQVGKAAEPQVGKAAEPQVGKAAAPHVGKAAEPQVGKAAFAASSFTQGAHIPSDGQGLPASCPRLTGLHALPGAGSSGEWAGAVALITHTITSAPRHPC